MTVSMPWLIKSLYSYTRKYYHTLYYTTLYCSTLYCSVVHYTVVYTLTEKNDCTYAMVNQKAILLHDTTLYYTTQCHTYVKAMWYL